MSLACDKHLIPVGGNVGGGPGVHYLGDMDIQPTEVITSVG